MSALQEIREKNKLPDGWKERSGRYHRRLADGLIEMAVYTLQIEPGGFVTEYQHTPSRTRFRDPVTAMRALDRRAKAAIRRAAAELGIVTHG